MKTHEVEKQLGVSKHTILYYEKEGLLKPHRDNNGYRDYQEKDITILKLIIELRNMEFTIDEIKSVMNGETSIRDILDHKEIYLEEKETNIQNTKDTIQKYKARKQIYISFMNQILDCQHYNKNYETLYFNHDHIKILDLFIHLKDIKSIRLSMCSQISSLMILRINMNYYVDIDLMTDFDTYSFQIMNEKDTKQLFIYLHEHQIAYEDILGLENIYMTMEDSVQRNKYINARFAKWAKKYNLDNPRGKYIFTHQDELKNGNVTIPKIKFLKK